MRHELKTSIIPFEMLWRGVKSWEVRSIKDRHFAIRDELCLQEWEPVTQTYTGRYIEAVIKGGMTGPVEHWYGLSIAAGYALLSIERRACVGAMRHFSDEAELLHEIASQPTEQPVPPADSV